MIPSLVAKVLRRDDLTEGEAAEAMAVVMRGEAHPAQLAGLLIALAMKGERPAELVGLARTMRAQGVRLEAGSDAVDTCGTGGDRSGTFNISTAAALVVAGAGLPVVKHGNRSVSSHCGSADVLGALGVTVAAPPAVVQRAVREAGIAFCFAPTFHPAMAHAVEARRALGVPTAFNLLGPLTNPAGVRYQVVGVARPELTELMARALQQLGARRAWVVHGADGLDELSTTGYSKVSECHGEVVRTFYVHPGDVGLPKAALGGSARRRRRRQRGHHSRRARREGRPGPRRRPAQRRRRAVRRRAGRVAAPGHRPGRRLDRRRARRPGVVGVVRRHRERGMKATTPDLLEAIVAAVRRDLQTRRQRVAYDALEQVAWHTPVPRGHQFAEALRRPGAVNVIAECKRRSPSRGVLQAAYDPAAQARAYARGGAVAVSVLTEPAFFDGSLEHLSAVRAAIDLPCLRKDFVVDGYQLLEARAAGADAVLLIVSALDDERLARLLAQAQALHLAALVEVHDEDELARAVDAGATIVGVNNRNLRTLAVDLDVSARVAARLPAGVTAVSESGVGSAADVARLRDSRLPRVPHRRAADGRARPRRRPAAPLRHRKDAADGGARQDLRAHAHRRCGGRGARRRRRRRLRAVAGQPARRQPWNGRRSWGARCHPGRRASASSSRCRWTRCARRCRPRASAPSNCTASPMPRRTWRCRCRCSGRCRCATAAPTRPPRPARR